MPTKTTPDAETRERQRIGETLRTLRVRDGWDLGSFATKLNISYSYLSNIEAGRKPLTDVLLARAAKLLDCKPIAIKHPEVVIDEQVPA